MSYMLIHVERTTTPWLRTGGCTVFGDSQLLTELLTPIGCGPLA